MKAKYLRGDTKPIDHTPGSAVDAGDVFIIEDLVVVAPFAIAANVLGTVNTGGIYEVAKITEDDINVGETVYWDASGVPAEDPEATDGAASSSVEGGTPMGHAVEAGALDGFTVVVQLNQTTVAAS
jgi:predicted RecA/RadA family phage recombinase